jgi:type I restriction enzyme S subunit
MQHEPLLKAAPFSGSRVQPFDGTRRYLSTGDLQEATTSFVEVTYADKPSRADISVRPGDVLFARMKGTKKVLEIDHSLANIIVSTGFAVIRPTEHCSGKYLSIFLKSDDFERQKEKYCSGAIQPAITNAGIKNLTIPFPPLDDQKRIAHLLGKVGGLIARRKHHLQQLDDLLKSVFLEMFGDPVRNEKGWDTGLLGKLATIERGRFSPRPRNDPKFYNGAYPFIQTGDISRSNGRLREYTQTLNELGIKVSKEFDVGTIVIAIVGATIGETAILQIPTYAPDSVIGITPKSEAKETESVFIEFLLRFWKPVLRARAPEAARANINIETLRPLPVIWPLEDDREKFAAIVEKVEGLKSRYQQSLADLESLYGALSQKAFKGELDLSRVALPAEGSEIFEEEKTDVEETQSMEPLFELPAPEEPALLQTAEGRKSLLGDWLNSWLAQLGDAPFIVQNFMEAARQRLWELVEDDAPDWGAAEYDQLKAWLFAALEQGRLIQGYDDANNRVQITAVKG